VRLEVSENELYLKNGRIYELILKFPFHVDKTNVIAQFNTTTRKMIVKLKVIIILIK
jgi:hypothetical protein